MPKENQNTGHIAQSPHINESVDDILSTVNQFIEGVYRDLSWTLPHGSTSQNSDHNCSRSLDENSLISLSDSVSVAPTSSLFVSDGDRGTIALPSGPVDMLARIENMDLMCEGFNEKCNEISVIMKSIADSNNSMNGNTTSSNRSSISVLSLDSPPPRPVVSCSKSRRQHSNDRHTIATVPSYVVDLSKSQTQTYESCLNNINSDNDDDDVILVSSNIHPIVDLCTPGKYKETHRRRRRLPPSDVDIIEACDEQGPSTSRRCRTVYHRPSQSRPRRLNSSVFEVESNTIEKSPPVGTTAFDHTPFICPVCMESCLQRQPTSTRCGHVFCQECIKHAIRLTHKCPMCNKKILKNQIFRIYV